MNAEKWLKREVKWAREYAVKRKDDGLVDEARENLTKCGSGAVELAPVVSDLQTLANWYGAVGCVAVLDGDGTGYELVDRACLYNFWGIQLMARGYDLDQRPNKQPRGLLMDEIARCWIHAEAIGAAAIRRVLDSLIVRVHEGYGGVAGRDMNALGTLVAHHATKRDVDELEKRGWAPIETYRTAITGMPSQRDCEAFAAYHQRNVDGDGYPAFCTYPYRLAALELLAIARRTGAPVCGLHPLITSPLARPRDVDTLASPDEIRPVLERAARDFDIES